ncbi:hypothetical protein KCG43_20360 [Photobacterium sp. WH24]|uniref:hypothetical protein n=1 Tax=Photobacterium sp. WH24 TaxID=2827237 RepID=UPI001C4787D7|nr:hypothetical protein [Photobacterium sp. WH24]MBV7264368.1 hypothetical protein [Photobacterium sp. WH24]
MAEKTLTAPPENKVQREYIALAPFRFLSRWHQKDDVLMLKPSQAEYFINKGKLKAKEAK